jgi:hypothetical protein
LDTGVENIGSKLKVVRYILHALDNYHSSRGTR